MQKAVKDFISLARNLPEFPNRLRCGMRRARIIRKSFPRIRIVPRKSGDFYEIDPRRKNKGKRLYRKNRAEAEKLAQEIAARYEEIGKEGLDFPAELRVMALDCSRRLEEYGKTIADAADYYLIHLKASKETANSRTISDLVDEWLSEKRTSKRKPLARDTVMELEKMGRKLKTAFGDARIRTIEQRHIESSIDNLEVGNQTSQNILVKWGQFFNWAIRKQYTTHNPCANVEAYPTGREIRRYDAESIERMLRVCEDDFRDLLPYIAICVFAGLRPSECERLQWSKVALETRPPQIEVIKSTIAVKDYTRYVTIERNLFEWLGLCKERNGTIIQPNFHNRIKEFKIKAGFQLEGENLDGERWIPDGLRHTYASFWLARNPNEGELARQMGNSVAMIRQHYNKAVRPDQVESFWRILPRGVAERWERMENEPPEWTPTGSYKVADNDPFNDPAFFDDLQEDMHTS